MITNLLLYLQVHSPCLLVQAVTCGYGRISSSPTSIHRSPNDNGIKAYGFRFRSSLNHTSVMSASTTHYLPLDSDAPPVFSSLMTNDRVYGELRLVSYINTV
jgi:hypothetical protein